VQTDDVIKNTGEAVAKIIEKVPVYEDAIQPLAKEVGRALGTIGGLINLALAPISVMVQGYGYIQENITRRLEEKLSKTSPDNIVQPPLPVVGPLLERYRYVHDDHELSEMFVNLLANAMDADHIRKAHPAFVQVISQLCPEEAKLIRAISGKNLVPKLDVGAVLPGAEGESPLLYNFTHLPSRASIEGCGDLIYSYIDNLIRLGLLNTTYGALSDSFVDERNYELLIGDPAIKDIEKMLSDRGHQISIHKGVIRVTPFGKLFMGAVLQKL
jgi:Abortive infection alpha